MFYIYPYSSASNSARLLAQAMNAKRLKLDASRARLSANDILINWGRSHFDRIINNITVLNKPEFVRNATDKLRTYALLKQANIPTCEYTTDLNVASQWYRDGYTVMGRDLVASSSGAGITVYPSGAVSVPPIRQHKFYTKYFKHKVELRVHCFKDQEPHIQRKAKRNDWVANYGHIINATYIHSHNNGYVYVINGINPYNISYNPAIQGCQKALEKLNLDFGAFDVLIKSNGEYQILEVNTAPGIEGYTLDIYKTKLSLNTYA